MFYDIFPQEDVINNVLEISITNLTWIIVFVLWSTVVLYNINPSGPPQRSEPFDSLDRPVNFVQKFQG